jgi:eukaryotic-like serine/threonine-protein kinase
VASYFPADTFPVQQDLTFVCEEPDPRKGTPRMRARIVMGSRGVLTSGMDEWARLGWYELVVWATLRAGCCPGAPVIEIPESDPPCDSLGPAAERTARALVAHQQAETAEHLAAFEKGAMCLQFQEKKVFKYTNPPRSGGQLAWGKFVTRAMSRP